MKYWHSTRWQRLQIKRTITKWLSGSVRLFVHSQSFEKLTHFLFSMGDDCVLLSVWSSCVCDGLLGRKESLWKAQNNRRHHKVFRHQEIPKGILGTCCNGCFLLLCHISLHILCNVSPFLSSSCFDCIAFSDFLQEARGLDEDEAGRYVSILSFVALFLGPAIGLLLDRSTKVLLSFHSDFLPQLEREQSQVCSCFKDLLNLLLALS